MYAEERRRLLVKLARSDGRVQVSGASQHFHVTPETIRRDLEVLDRQGLLRRVHGGAMPAEFLPMGDLALVDRENAAAEQKDRIAQAALAFLPEQPRASVLLDAGTTTSRLAQLLPAQSTLEVFTHSLPIAASLSVRTSAAVELVGGTVKGITQACVGAPSLERLAQLRVNVCFLGTNGITPGHGLSTPDSEEGAVKARMVRSARLVVVLADSRKFDVETTHSFARLADVDVVITDAITPTQQEYCSNQGIEVVVA